MNKLKLKTKNPIMCFFIIILMVTIASCSESTDTSSDRIVVAVSIVPQETFVKQIAGDLIDVVTMIPPGSNPENFAPSPQQLQDFSKASIYFSIGVPAEDANILPKAMDINKNIKIV